MGGRRVAGGREGGMGPGPSLPPALPPLPKDLAVELRHGRLMEPVVEGHVVETTRASARDLGLVEAARRTSIARREPVVGVGTEQRRRHAREQRLQPLLI